MEEHKRIELIDPFDTDALEAAKKKLSERERIAALIEVTDLKWLMGHKQGRRIVWRFLERHGVYRSSFSRDALEMAFLEGQRNDGLRLLGELLEHTPDRYAEMLGEHKDARSSSSKPGSGGTSSGSGTNDPRDE